MCKPSYSITIFVEVPNFLLAFFKTHTIAIIKSLIIIILAIDEELLILLHKIRLHYFRFLINVLVQHYSTLLKIHNYSYLLIIMNI
jgi:hypothetical protein